MSDPQSSTSMPVPQALSALTEYFVGDATLGDTLRRVSDVVVDAIPAASFVGLTMMVDGRVGTFVFTHPDAPEIDQRQYETGRGPCVDAFRDGRVHQVPSTLTDTRWPEFAAAAAQHGILSTASFPMSSTIGPLGAMNVYADVENGFDDDDVEVGRALAAQAGFLLSNAQAYWDARSLSENLAAALESRAEIEQAKGIIMATQRVSADRAFEILSEQSQHQNIKLRTVARDLLATYGRLPR